MLNLSKVSATPGRSSENRHRNQLTAKAWGKAVQELGEFSSSQETSGTLGKTNSRI